METFLKVPKYVKIADTSGAMKWWLSLVVFTLRNQVQFTFETYLR